MTRGKEGRILRLLYASNFVSGEARECLCASRYVWARGSLALSFYPLNHGLIQPWFYEEATSGVGIFSFS